MKNKLGIFLGFCLMLIQAEYSFAHIEPIDTTSIVSYEAEVMIDENLSGVDILRLVNVQQTPAMEKALRNHIRTNADKQISGYRVTIYYDNKQSARTESAEVFNRFLARYKGIPAYRTYSNPYFKVTIGDFRTKSEAHEILEMIKGTFPKSFIVGEFVNYPSVQRKEIELVDETLYKSPIEIF